MVELRKRKTPPPQPEKPAKKKPGPRSKAQKAKEAVTEPDAAKAQEVVAETAIDAKGAVQEVAAQVQDTVASAVNGATAAATSAATAAAAATTPAGKPEKGSKIELEGFGGEVETHDGKKVTLKQLVDESGAGVVLFTYPKASTPGCTKQACLFRDAHTTLTSSSGFSIYGLSADTPKANSTFKTKQKLPFTLLCDGGNTLLRAIGLAKTPKGANRGVFIVDKNGVVLAAEGGGPERTLAVAKEVGAADAAGDAEKEGSKEDKERADVAGEVADTAQRIDGGKGE